MLNDLACNCYTRKIVFFKSSNNKNNYTLHSKPVNVTLSSCDIRRSSLKQLECTLSYNI